MTIRKMARSDMDEVCRLHQQNIKSISAKIGLEYLQALYGFLLSDSQNHCCFVACYEKEVVGAISASLDLGQTKRIFTKQLLSPKIIFAVSGAIILGRAGVLELAQRVVFESVVTRKFKQPFSTILTLFVSARFRRLGIAANLTQEVIKIVKHQKIKRLYVDTYSVNNQALAFYEALGFRIKDKIIDSVVLEYEIN